jgi:alpha-ketoglutarate-dependent taurine dioxygenase
MVTVSAAAPSAIELEREPGRPGIVHYKDAPDIRHAVAWLRGADTTLRSWLHSYGSIHVRGLPIRSVDDFALARSALLAKRTGYREKATPRSDYGNDVFSSTDLPPAQAIRQHNENSYTLTFPGILLFCCLQAPADGGATPVTDCREVLRLLPPELVIRFRRHGWRLSRTFGEHISLDWRTSFGTDSPQEVARYCAANQIDVRWGDDGTLHTTQTRSAIVRHPLTGEDVWFNHVAFWNEWALDPDIREVLVSEFGRDSLPFNTAVGNGESLTAAEVAAIDQAYAGATVRESWQLGDLLIVDNILAAHGREPFRGDRKIVVAMGEPVDRSETE